MAWPTVPPPLWCGVEVGWGVKIISSKDIMFHVHSHPPSHHIGKILDGQLLFIRRINFIVAKELSPPNCAQINENLGTEHYKWQLLVAAWS